MAKKDELLIEALAGRGKMLSNREFLGIYRLESNA
jgi:hypothetical protein